MVHRGLPAVVLVTERFTALAKAVRTGKGMPDLPTVVMPLNPQFYPAGEVERATEKLIEPFVALIAPAVAGKGKAA